MSIRQIAALPYMPDSSGSVRLLMITSRETHRWVIPKGNVMLGVPPHLAAAQEAFEEAGVLGIASPAALGSYSYWKRHKDGRLEQASVDVFPMEVRTEAAQWPEAAQRERRWFSLAEAMEIVEEEGLKALVAAFGAEFRPRDSAAGRGSG